MPPNCEDYCVIKIPRKEMQGLIRLLAVTGIPHEIPENFELIEYYQSKL